MITFTESLADTLRQARQKKSLSQRELSERTGVPQSHISKIEKGDVDLRTSSLRTIANALDLEIALVPKKTMPAVKSITRAIKTTSSSIENFETRRAEHLRIVASALQANGARPAYRLDDDDDA